MKKLFIIGAGGFGREVLQWARDCKESGTEWTVAGFLDDNPRALDGFQVDIPIVGSIAEFRGDDDSRFVCAIGKPKLRRQCVSKLGPDRSFVNVIHPTAILGSRIELGTGIVICPYTVLTSDISVGDHTSINIRCSIGHDASLGKFCQLSSFCDVTGGVKIDDEVFMGSHATVLPGKRVGTGATIGAGSVVIMNVKSNTTVFGVPAKPIK